ncbi:MAG: hypothetical protein AVDCRST_MAG16-1913, partial [uncultured Frankineae bacterium]
AAGLAGGVRGLRRGRSRRPAARARRPLRQRRGRRRGRERRGPRPARAVRRGRADRARPVRRRPAGPHQPLPDPAVPAGRGPRPPARGDRRDGRARVRAPRGHRRRTAARARLGL